MASPRPVTPQPEASTSSTRPATPKPEASASSAESTAAIQNALRNHVIRFCDKDMNYTPATVAAGLEVIHGSQTTVKGAVISTFNATHSSTNIVCPVTGGRFVPDPKTGYARMLHLGTTRIWNAEGAFDEARWKKFADYVTKGQCPNQEQIVRISTLKAYLAKCYAEDPAEDNTGRNANSIFSSKYIQGTAAVKGWDETFDRLTCGQVKVEGDSDEMEPYITLKVIMEFFMNSNKAFARAQTGDLPAKPEVAEAPRPTRS